MKETPLHLAFKIEFYRRENKGLDRNHLYIFETLGRGKNFADEEEGIIENTQLSEVINNNNNSISTPTYYLVNLEKLFKIET